MESGNESGSERATKAGSAPIAAGAQSNSKLVKELGGEFESESDSIYNGLGMNDLQKETAVVEYADAPKGIGVAAKKIVRGFREWADRREIEINNILNKIDSRILGGFAGLFLILNALALLFWNRFEASKNISLENAFSLGLILFFCAVGLQPKFNSRIWTLLGTLAGLALWIGSLFVT